jgi:RNA polymerase sigma-54 factor
MQTLRQELRQRQEQILQPQQILRSELIQLPLLQLELRVRAELVENPFLEEISEEEAIVDKDASELESEKSAAATEEVEEPEESATPVAAAEEPVRIETETAKEEEIDWDNFLTDDQYHYRASRPSPEELVETPRAAVPTLAEHLDEQLRLQRLTDEEYKIGEFIIGSLSNDGYLTMSIEEIADEMKVAPEAVEKVLRVVQAFDPPGIAARNLTECLLLQLRQREISAPNAVRVLTECFDSFVNKRYEIIARKLNISLEEVKDAFEEIRKCNPKPGEGYFDEKQNYIIPDLVVSRVGDEFAVYLNDGYIPNFYINTAYKDMFLKGSTDKKVKEFVTRKLESARWFINAIHQRRTTILRTMRAIVKRQEDFFRKGKEHLKPMILQDIAEEIGMDISTISRVTSGKYVQTDWGVIELKFFFSERMETSSGDDVSTKVIKDRLKEIITGENKSDPLSDQAIADILAKEGFPIARRTVQKYREQLRVPVKRLRREI